MRKHETKRLFRRGRMLSLLLAVLILLSAVSVLSTVVAARDTEVAPSGAESWEMVAPVESGHDSSKAFWVDATYYDYLSDTELTAGWLNPKEAGTGFASKDDASHVSDDDWYEFDRFNNLISSYDSSWQYPLYFGNFCNAIDGHETPAGEQGFTLTAYNSSAHGGGYSQKINGLHNYEYFINNSNGLTDYHYSVKGLAYDSLDANGNIQYAAGKQMPYFNSLWLNQNNAAKMIVSSFPFRQTRSADAEDITIYSFDSQDAKDNVFFNWQGTDPHEVGYGQGAADDGAPIASGVSAYGVRDGIQYFMSPTGIDKDYNTEYQAHDYYGIFPFNRPYGTNLSRRNNNLDYGFGIKMNMDFRVPTGGKIGNTPITFDYSGDDDLWVYLSEYNSNGQMVNSQLVLDLGGNHKKATGRIDFSTMTAYADTTTAATHNVKFKSDKIYIVNNGISETDTTPISNVWIYAWKDGEDHETWIQYNTANNVSIDDQVYMTISAAQMDGYDHFLLTNAKPNAKNDWSNVTKQTRDSLPISGYFGNVCYTNNLQWIEEQLPNVTYTQNDEKHFGFEKNADGVTYKTLDPNKIYHMTIFYMERGMLESNCMMSFTMTPVKNDFKVKKTVETEGINAGLKTAIEGLPFNFTTTEDGEVRTDTKYTLSGVQKNVGATGVYTLSHGQLADFANQHPTGSTLKVSETLPSGVQFTTRWEVVDNSKNGAVIKLKNNADASGNTTSTGDFELKDPNNAYAPANLQANFVNTPRTATFEVAKEVFADPGDIFDDDDDDDIDDQVDDQFGFRLRVNLSGAAYSAQTANQFVAYKNLAYTTTGTNYATGRTYTTSGITDANGEFTVRAGAKVTFQGMPVGATYYLEELGVDGYTPVAYSRNGQPEERFSGNAAISGVFGDDLSLCICNVQGEEHGAFSVRKEVEIDENTRVPYIDGSLFSIRAKGLKNVNYARGMTSQDASVMTKVSDTQDYVEVDEIGADGLALFASNTTFLSFHHAGVYIFDVYESPIVNNTDVIDNDAMSAYAHDFSEANTQHFLVRFDVTAREGDIVVGLPTYYLYDGGAITPESFSNPLDRDQIPVFVNKVKHGKVHIEKTGGDNKPLQGVKFTLYRVDSTATGDTLTEVGVKTTDASGIADFDNLEIYRKDNDVYSGKPEYQVYELKETETKNGHYMEKTVYRFTIPMADSAHPGEPTYTLTFKYINGVLKTPKAGLFGMGDPVRLGVAIVFLAILSMALYAVILRRKRLQYSPVHLRVSK